MSELEEALELFRRTRSRGAADRVDRATGEATKLPRALGRDDLQRSWLAMAKSMRAEDVPALLEALPRHVDIEDRFRMLQPVERRFAYLEERITALAKMPDDPRISRALVALILRAPWTADWGRSLGFIYDPMLALIARTGDPRAIPILREAIERPRWRVQVIRLYMLEKLAEVVRALEAIPRTETENEESASPTSHATESELLAAIHEDPDDDDARLVLSDFLLERGDPRGELIALQFKDDDATPKEQKRIKSLIRAHAERWLGEIYLVTKNREFKRGMLEEAELLAASAAEPATWERVLADPRLSTLRRLVKGKANEDLFVRFLASPARRSLRRVQAMTMATITAIAEASAPFERLECVEIERPSKEALAAIAGASTLPSLQSVELGCDADRLPTLCRTLREHPLLRRIQSLYVSLSWRSGEQNFGEILDRLGALDVSEVGIVYYHQRITARRDSGALAVTMETSSAYSLPARIATLPTCARVGLRWTGNDAEIVAQEREIFAALRARAPVVDLDPRLQKLFRQEMSR